MSEAVKKTKITTESMVRDIATSIESIATTLVSINQLHSNLLRVNKAVVALKLNLEKDKKEDLNKTVPIPEGKMNK